MFGPELDSNASPAYARGSAIRWRGSAAAAHLLSVKTSSTGSPTDDEAPNVSKTTWRGRTTAIARVEQTCAGSDFRPTRRLTS
jgi:hypothetical protein